MRLQSLLVLASSLTLIQARQPTADLEERSFLDLGFSCLGWGLISPAVGIFCYFTTGSEEEKAAEKKVLDAAENLALAAASDLKALVKFDLTHNPGTVAFNYVRTASQDGISAANAGLRKTGKDFIDVTVGFTKETANQGIQLYNLLEWQDVNLCIISGVTNLTTQLPQTSRKIRRAPQSLNQQDASDLATKCIKEKFKKITGPPTFNLTNPNQKVGATISDIAAFLIPVGGEAGSVHSAEGAAADLAFPGEDTSRIYKWAEDATSPTAEHFSSPEEAQSVADKLTEDPTWQEEKCGACNPLVVPALKKRHRRSGRSGQATNQHGRLQRRVNFFGICCKTPPVKEGPATGANPSGAALVDEVELDTSHLTTATELEVAEKSFGPPRMLNAHDLDGADSAAAAADLGATMAQTGTSALKWPKALTDITSSKNLFQDLRNIFEKPDSDVFKALRLKPINPDFARLIFDSQTLSLADQTLLPKGLVEWDTAARRICRDAVSGVTQRAKDGSKILQANIEYFYSPPGTVRFGKDFHTDDGLMLFGAQDLDGIVFQEPHGAMTSYRVQLQDDVFSTFRGRRYDGQVDASKATNHRVYGPDIVNKGRVSMILRVDEIKNVYGSA